MTHQPGHVTDEMKRCIKACADCFAICEQTAAYCVNKGGKHAEANHVRLLLDCAAICATGAGFMARGSPLHTKTCGVCADVCAQCADSCAAMKDDAQMKACADTCRACAESCRKMAA